MKYTVKNWNVTMAQGDITLNCKAEEVEFDVSCYEASQLIGSIKDLITGCVALGMGVKKEEEPEEPEDKE